MSLIVTQDDIEFIDCNKHLDFTFNECYIKVKNNYLKFNIQTFDDFVEAIEFCFKFTNETGIINLEDPLEYIDYKFDEIIYKLKFL